jgi:homoserine kinase
MYLELDVGNDPSQPPTPLNCKLSYEGVSPEGIDLDPENNLITRTALYVLRCHNQHHFPAGTTVHINNPIPLGRGLGSSGAAVVAGALLGNLVGKLNLPHERVLDFILMVERHPDNVAAALYGGFVGTYLNELNPDDMARIEVPLSEVLPQPAGGVDTGLRPPIPPENIGHFRRFVWNKELKAIAIIPDFEVSTAKAREVLPKTYTRQDMVSRTPRLSADRPYSLLQLHSTDPPFFPIHRSSTSNASPSSPQSSPTPRPTRT